MYTLNNVTLRLNGKGQIAVEGEDRLSTVKIPVKVITFMGRGFSFNVQAGNKQYYIPFENIDTKKVSAPMDMILTADLDNVDCPALFLYDLLAEYIFWKRKVFEGRDFSLDAIKARHKACACIYRDIDLEGMLHDIKI